MTKTISTYIITINSLFFQSTLEQTIRQAILFSDEVVICPSTLTSDGTFNLLDSLSSEYPNIVKVYPYKEDSSNIENNQGILEDRKTFALKKCTKDYCILQDDDECVHEKYATHIRQLPDIYPSTIAFKFNVIHFYRSYNRYQNSPGWYPKKIYMFKNISSIKHGRVGNDPDNHVISLPVNNMIQTVPLDSLPSPQIVDTPITVYHYGWCRNDAILLMKKYFQEVTWWGKDYWKSHEFPYKFDNPNNLPEFKDSHPTYMIPIIEHERKFGAKYIKHFDKS